MPITAEELARKIAKDLLRKYAKGLTIGQVQDALTGMGGAERQRLVSLIASQQPLPVGEFIVRKVREHLTGLAKTEADGIVADNALNATEINRWLGDG